MTEKRITLLTILSKINFTQVITGIITLGVAWIGLRQHLAINAQDEQSVKTQQVQKYDSSYKKKNDARWDSLFKTLNEKK